MLRFSQENRPTATISEATTMTVLTLMSAFRVSQQAIPLASGMNILSTVQEQARTSKIDEDDDTWRCWRHDCTGNAMHMVGMQAGIVDCGDWKQGGLSSEIWADIFEEARNRGIIDDDRRAAPAEELAGSGEHEKGDLDDDEDSSKKYQKPR